MSATNSYKVKLVLSIIEEHFGSVTKVNAQLQIIKTLLLQSDDE